jgi:RND family efflux transporter MFP subunit
VVCPKLDIHLIFAPFNMKKSTLWIVSAVAAALLLAVGSRWLSQRQPASEAAKTSTPAAPVIELSASDVVRVQNMNMVLGLPVSGTLKASQSAMVKARVVGELMDLTVREGDMVKAGQVIARIDPTEYQARERQAKQQADAAWAQVDIAQKQYDNNKALVEQGFISQTALQNAMASLNGAKATHMAAVAALDVTRKALEDATIRAPISGQVAQRLAQPGERMALDARIVEVVNLSQLELEAALPAADAGLVRKGMKAQLKIEGQEESVTAQVLRINPSAQAASRSVLVYLGLSGHEGLRQGLFAEGLLGTRTAQALAVPLSSVRTDKPQPYVQVVDGERVRHVSVQTGTRTEKTMQNITLTWVEVGGLSEGTQVLMASAGAVREGTQVKFTTGVR